MKQSDNPAAQAFAERLGALMRAAGRVSDSSRSGVDVVALAEAAGTSYEMARRYAEGLAIPRADTMARIAAWLDVAPAVLAWGPGEETGSTINQEVLQQCIKAVMDAQARAGVDVPTERAAALVAALYQEAMDGRFPLPATVSRMLKAFA